jgi:hypothetical protein
LSIICPHHWVFCSERIGSIGSAELRSLYFSAQPASLEVERALAGPPRGFIADENLATPELGGEHLWSGNKAEASRQFAIGGTMCREQQPSEIERIGVNDLSLRLLDQVLRNAQAAIRPQNRKLRISRDAVVHGKCESISAMQLDVAGGFDDTQRRNAVTPPIAAKKMMNAGCSGSWQQIKAGSTFIVEYLPANPEDGGPLLDSCDLLNPDVHIPVSPPVGGCGATPRRSENIL